MRRTLPPEPWSQVALWSRSVAVFAATVALLTVLLARLKIIAPVSALASLGAAVALALVALLLVGASSVVMWRTGRRGAGAAFVGALIAIATLAYPSYLAFEFDTPAGPVRHFHGRRQPALFLALPRRL